MDEAFSQLNAYLFSSSPECRHWSPIDSENIVEPTDAPDIRDSRIDLNQGVWSSNSSDDISFGPTSLDYSSMGLGQYVWLSTDHNPLDTSEFDRVASASWEPFQTGTFSSSSGSSDSHTTTNTHLFSDSSSEAPADNWRKSPGEEAPNSGNEAKCHPEASQGTQE
ncbi:uncharacterized protein BKCO1_2100077 [Diplodia corticola]|uniref:Uncharacterized protein n=1 Tax=Diplodia corticola TaxID=236234 RepID=A0A1J9R363_9PEZI|nr:uncharacterized protein BKCO1_2100077 [Diplodia corticola]OJD34666.1 hypothetical protein BKCO1_2100077 [Diplodia corticola]